MYSATIDHFSELAAKKATALRETPIAFLAAAAMAGAYIGIGIILMLSVAATADPSLQKLLMGATFGIALTLVVFAGSELFTGHTMYMVLGWLSERTGVADMLKVWTAVWLGNLAGAVGLAVIFVAGGGGELLHAGQPLLIKVASYKMNGSPVELLARGILCNWLVCLALWMCARTRSDATKCIVIFWCLLAFIASGYEHSVANMTLFSIALLGDHPESVSLAGMAHNLTWVTLGNTIAGAVFMAGGYWLAGDRRSSGQQPAFTPANPQPAET
ncbi:MAG: formate/nitrite transporter family protein [Rhodospirillales bacterium]|nr:formate/nitrite transporter family protein [Rhodospirillales bacterium]